MRAPAACFGVVNDVCTGCDTAAAAVWFDFGAVWARTDKAHNSATAGVATRDLDDKNLNIPDLM
jgi:hypothetical protein